MHRLQSCENFPPLNAESSPLYKAMRELLPRAKTHMPIIGIDLAVWKLLEWSGDLGTYHSDEGFADMRPGN